MSTDPFDDDQPESTAEAMVFLGLLALIGLMAIVAGTARWWRAILPALLLLLIPSTATAQSERATHLALAGYMTSAFFDASVHKRSRECLIYAPPHTTDARRDKGLTETSSSRPFGNGQIHPVVFNATARPSVVGLFSTCRPPAIDFAIWPVVVDSLECAALRRASHVRQELFVGQSPLAADCDASAAISTVAGVGWLIAAPDHLMVAPQFSCVYATARVSMCQVKRGDALTGETSTGFGEAFQERSNRRDGLVAAVTLTNETPIQTVVSLPLVTDHDESDEPSPHVFIGTDPWREDASTARHSSTISQHYPTEDAFGKATHWALAAYITAADFDIAITSYAIGRGNAHEANPILAPIVERHGVAVAMTVKGGMHVGIAALILHYHKDAPKRTFWITVGLTAAQVAVDVVNVRTHRDRQ